MKYLLKRIIRTMLRIFFPQYRKYYKYYKYSKRFRHTRKTYYNSFIAVKSPRDFLKLFQAEQGKTVRTKTPVLFNKVPFDSDIRKIKNTIGTPRYTFKNPDMKGHIILFYKIIVAQHKSIAQFHLLNDHFFYGQFTFHKLNENSLTTFQKALKEKYLPPDTVIDENTIVKDHNNNRILLNNTNAFTVNYISGNPEYEKKLQELLQEAAISQEKKANDIKKHL